MDDSPQSPDTHRTRRGAVLITGAASGIGAATTQWLLEKGYFVFAGMRRAAQLDSAREQARQSACLQPVQLDVTSPEQIQQAVTTIQQTLRQRELRFVGLVNNAADENLGPVEVLPVEVFRREIEVGYLGMVAVTKAMLPLLRESGGRIVNMSSINGRCTFKHHATTCATKYAVEAFSDALRMELKPQGMHVAIIEPGPTDTPLMREKTIEEFTEKLAQYPREELDRYFPDFDATVRNVERFVQRIQQPPKHKLAKLRRLLSGQGWLHSPLEVARVIEHALSARKPKTRYLIGAQAKSIYLMRRLLSDRRFDRFLGENVFDF